MFLYTTCVYEMYYKNSRHTWNLCGGTMWLLRCFGCQKSDLASVWFVIRSCSVCESSQIVNARLFFGFSERETSIPEFWLCVSKSGHPPYISMIVRHIHTASFWNPKKKVPGTDGAFLLTVSARVPQLTWTLHAWLRIRVVYCTNGNIKTENSFSGMEFRSAQNVAILLTELSGLIQYNPV